MILRALAARIAEQPFQTEFRLRAFRRECVMQYFHPANRFSLLQPSPSPTLLMVLSSITLSIPPGWAIEDRSLEFHGFHCFNLAHVLDVQSIENFCALVTGVCASGVIKNHIRYGCIVRPFPREGCHCCLSHYINFRIIVIVVGVQILMIGMVVMALCAALPKSIAHTRRPIALLLQKQYKMTMLKVVPC